MSKVTLSATSFKPQASPATWLGVMGGGQLGRMFAHAGTGDGLQSRRAGTC